MGSIKPLEESSGGRLGKIDAPLNEKLKNIKWGEYRLEKLFDSSNGDFDIQKKHINNKGNYVITAGLTNNGILGKTDVPAKVFEPQTITVDMFGSAFYRQFEYKMVTHARVFSLKPKFKINDEQGLFLSNSLKFLEKFFGYENMCSWEKIKNRMIALPTTKEGEIDFNFMESFVRELEEERVRELAAYLKVSGLADTTLTASEQAALNAFDTLEWGEFNVTRVFNVKNTHNILSSEIEENSGEIPYLCASAENNGVSSYISYNTNFLEKGNCIFIGGKTFIVSYQKDSFFSNDSHNLALYLKDFKADKSNQLYLATCIRKSLAHKYSWGNSVSKAKIKNDKVMLPVLNGEPDYMAMQNLISAVQKLVIKDVVAYADKKISQTKEIINT